MFFKTKTRKLGVRVLDEEEAKVRNFVLIPCQNFRRRDFCIIIDVGNVPNIEASQLHKKNL